MSRNNKGIIAVVILIVIANELTAWPILRLWNIYANRGFIDLYSPLHHIECFARGVDIEVLRQEDGPCGGYWYGSILLYLGKFLNLSTSSKYFLAAAILIPLTYLMVSYTRPVFLHRDLTSRILLTASVVSPPSILLFQRGNLDSIMVVLLLLSIKLFESSNNRVLAGWFLIFLATLLKFWSLPSLFVGLFWIKNKVLKLLASFVVILVTFIVLDQYRSVDFGSALPSNENTFGARFFSLTLNSTVSYSFSPRKSLVVDLIATFLILIISLLLIRSLSIRGLVTDLKDSLDGSKEVWILGSSFVFCYFASTNVDYRLVLPLALSVIAKMEFQQNSYLFLFLIFTTMWLTFPSGKLQLLGDFLAGMLVCLLVIYFLSQLKTIILRRFTF